MSEERTDDQRTMAGVPVEVEKGPTPGAAAIVRQNLRKAAANLPSVTTAITGAERQLEALRAEQEIWRTSCDELMDALAALGAVVYPKWLDGAPR